MALTWRPLETKDAQAWAELSEAIAAADRHKWTVSPDSAIRRLSDPSIDRELDTWSVWDGDTIVAYATSAAADELRYDGKAQAYLTGGVHPDWRGQGIGTELLGKVMQRAAAVLDESFPNDEKVLLVESGDEADPAIKLLTDNGFAAQRYFHDMERPAPAPGEMPDRSQPAPTVRVIPASEADSEQIRLAHNDAFRTHWGSGPASPQHWESDMEPIDMEMSRVAVDENGRVLAYALVDTKKPHRPYINLVGSRAEARGMGLGRATLGEYLRGLEGNADVTETGLDVDSENVFGAGRLYQDLGFEITRTFAAMEKPV